MTQCRTGEDISYSVLDFAIRVLQPFLRTPLCLQKLETSVMTAAPSLLQRLARVSLVTQIVIGLIAGILLALLLPEAAKATGFIGKVFV